MQRKIKCLEYENVLNLPDEKNIWIEDIISDETDFHSTLEFPGHNFKGMTQKELLRFVCGRATL